MAAWFRRPSNRPRHPFSPVVPQSERRVLVLLTAKIQFIMEHYNHRNMRKFVNDCIYAKFLNVYNNSLDAGAVADAITDDVVNDILETADPENWHSGDVDISTMRVLKKRLNID